MTATDDDTPGSRPAPGTAIRSWTVLLIGPEKMEACVPSRLEPGIHTVHGALTPAAMVPPGVIDKALEIASQGRTVLCAPDALMGVPGTHADLARVRAAGACVRSAPSALAAMAQAREDRARDFVYLAAGFERAAVESALTLLQAKRERLTNFLLLTCHIPFPTAVALLLRSPMGRAQACVLPMEECALLGSDAFEPLAARHAIPIALAETTLDGVADAVEACEHEHRLGRHGILNRRPAQISFRGDLRAQRILRETFRLIPARWRGHGLVPRSGLGLRIEHRAYDAEQRFGPVEPVREGLSDTPFSPTEALSPAAMA